MNKVNNIVLSILMIATFSQSSLAESAITLDGLLEKVISGRNADFVENTRRVNEFKRAKNKQKGLLSKAVLNTKNEEKKSNKLNFEISKNDQEITSLELQLADRLGNFGELFGVTRQVAGDTRAQVESSLITAQFKNRVEPLEALTESKRLPTMAQLRVLWSTLLREQTEQGRVARFSTDISNMSGFMERKEVIRFGPFSAVTDGKYLTYKEQAQQFGYLFRQPGGQYTKQVEKLMTASEGEVVSVAIDPSRGVILNLLVQSPSLLQRFKQGGLPGYVVSFLAVIGLSIGFVRLITLWMIGRKVQKQMHNKKISTGNPLGRIFKAYAENPHVDVETLELKLEDVILKEVPKLEQGLGIVKVLAAISPLIGLLGTVVGMILTFQAITLWGTGDPKIMAGGISQALVTTVQGLIAAIPLLLLHSLTSGRARLIQQVLEEQSAGLIAKRAEYGHG